MKLADWFFVASIVVLATTGLLIAHPYLAGNSHKCALAMNVVRTAHFAAAIAFVLSFALRLRSSTWWKAAASLPQSLLIATGFALYSQSAHIGSPMKMFSVLIPLFGGLRSATLIHHVAMWLLPLALIAAKPRPVTPVTGPCE